MCGGGGESTYNPKYDRGYSGQSGGTVIPTRVYNNSYPKLSQYEIIDGVYVDTGPVDTSTFPAYDGAILMTGSGTYTAISDAPTTGGNTSVVGVGGGWGAKGGGLTYAEYITDRVNAGEDPAKMSDINSGNLVTVYNITTTGIDPNNTYAPPYDYTQSGNQAQSSQVTIWTKNYWCGLGGSAILTNGNSVTLAGTTSNIYGAIT